MKQKNYEIFSKLLYRTLFLLLIIAVFSIFNFSDVPVTKAITGYNCSDVVIDLNSDTSSYSLLGFCENHVYSNDKYDFYCGVPFFAEKSVNLKIPGFDAFFKIDNRGNTIFLIDNQGIFTEGAIEDDQGNIDSSIQGIKIKTTTTDSNFAISGNKIFIPNKIITDYPLLAGSEIVNNSFVVKDTNDLPVAAFNKVDLNLYILGSLIFDGLMFEAKYDSSYLYKVQEFDSSEILGKNIIDIYNTTDFFQSAVKSFSIGQSLGLDNVNSFFGEVNKKYICEKTDKLNGYIFELADKCLISSTYYLDKGYNPDSACQICDTLKSLTSWTDLAKDANCSICGKCNDLGGCIYDETQDSDCGACEECGSLGECNACSDFCSSNVCTITYPTGSIAASSTKVLSGGSTTITVSDISDTGSGVQSVEIWEKKNTDAWAKVKEVNPYSSGNVTYTKTVSKVVGDIYYYGFHIIDKVGNMGTESSLIEVTVVECIVSTTEDKSCVSASNNCDDTTSGTQTKTCGVDYTWGAFGDCTATAPAEVTLTDCSACNACGDCNTVTATCDNPTPTCTAPVNTCCIIDQSNIPCTIQ